MIVNKKNEIAVLKDVQRNTEKAMKTIDTISTKIYDDGLALQLSRQALKYSELHNKAVDMLLEEKALPCPNNNLQDLMLSGSVQFNTILDTSTSHIAELMIRGTQDGLTSMWRTMNHQDALGNRSVEIAKELMDFEEKNIEVLKKYL